MKTTNIILLLLAILFTICAAWLYFSKTTPNSMENDVQSKIAAIPENAELATFAGGCFWCIENSFDNQTGVYEAVSGYVGGAEENANYQQVASGQTKHREAIQVYFDPEVISYKELLDLFWTQIDPTDAEGQFVDKGYQYTTAIYTHSDQQHEEAQNSRDELIKSSKDGKDIVTEVLHFEDNFYLAEEYHQDYAKKQSASYNRYKTNSGRK